MCKSITDVVRLLMEEGSLQMIFVGFLIFLFSIIFPSAKLISTLIHSYHLKKAGENKLVRFFVFKSGKWSMADVMVVAIFMAYIGFRGLVSSQLESLASTTRSLEILTTNGTSLMPGFFLFLSFCLLSLFLSTFLESRSPTSGVGGKIQAADA